MNDVGGAGGRTGVWTNVSGGRAIEKKRRNGQRTTRDPRRRRGKRARAGEARLGERACAQAREGRCRCEQEVVKEGVYTGGGRGRGREDARALGRAAGNEGEKGEHALGQWRRAEVPEDEGERAET
jgi:hypothetical protein